MKRTRTKIVATLGPASSSEEMIAKLYDAGVDIFRMNFSHGEPEDHQKVYDTIRKVETQKNRPIAVLADLQGPKLRLGVFENDQIELTEGQKYQFDMEDAPGNHLRAPLPHKEIFAAIKTGDLLLIDDGRMRFEVTKIEKTSMNVTAQTAGKLSNRKGVNLPGAHLPISALTRKDRKDLRFALSLGVDWVALSFVQGPEDVAELRKLVQKNAGIIAKLEKPLAIRHLDAIMDLTDAVMVARGDLGVEMPPESVPVIQKEIIKSARRKGKPVIVATQMLESMIENPSPTRAEASDVATAVYDGTDAVMLSGETAVGKYPVESAKIMDRIIGEVERSPSWKDFLAAGKREPENTTADAIMAAAHLAADTIQASAIVTYTSSGSTAFRAARERPIERIIGMTPNLTTARRLALVWGITVCMTEDANNMDDMVEKAIKAVKREGVAKQYDRIVVTAGIPFGSPGKTNLIRIARVN
ncbi:Pyruvate kinase [hydrothermal vent metagenome]|uniref:pyruvate kinase n=1 Tax=hydrothermal vent metagenome TaxID=652676 RepID=A0A3B0S5S4_9ZZZZ